MLLSLITVAFASDPAATEELQVGSARPITFATRTEIEFDPLAIAGELVDDGIDLVVEPARPRFNPLIQLRTDWKQELRWSIDDVK